MKLKSFTQFIVVGTIAAGFVLATPVIAKASVEQGADQQNGNDTEKTAGIPLKKIQPISKKEQERARNYFTDTVLTTQDGEDVRFYSDVLEGNIVAINVMYTSCQGACPMQTQKLSQISKALGELYGTDVRFVSLSSDAERDTPQALKNFAEKQGVDLSGWTFLTGKKSEIDPVIKKLGLFSANFEQHTSMILIGNTRTGHWKKIKPNTPHQAITFRIKALVDET